MSSGTTFTSTALTKSKSTPASADKDKHPQSSSSPSLKDQRAFEHDRQRLKKTADFLRFKVRKEQGGKAAQTHATVPMRCLKPRLAHRKRGSFGLGVEAGELASTLVDDKPHSPERVVTPHSRPGSEVVPRGRSEVMLADLIRPRKPRKAKENDFELVPHVRSVIVLDDHATQDIGLTFDEPWEHIGDSGSDEYEHDKSPSYASVVAHAQ